MYSKADWKNDPTTASVHVAAFFILAMLFHFLFNLIHAARRKIHRKLVAKTSFDIDARNCGVGKV